ncbi:hypothetical protein AB1288_18105 [Pseudomonas putida]|uniref:hypothetical protein n=1 Tax=Pseudomonas putida TaxID=303 RepID=UPI002A1DE94A|nr:hypothetical protein [Pseudomonas putida]
MDFKVSVSLWSQAQNTTAAATTSTSTTSDFKQRLGLDQQSTPRQGDAGQQRADQNEAPLGKGVFLEGQQPDANIPGFKSVPVRVDPAAGLELYALGLQAGTRLSHLPSGLLASAEAAYRANGSVATANATDTQQLLSTTLAPTPPVTAATPTHHQTVRAPVIPDTGSEEQALARLNEGFGAWHNARWPQRNYLLLPRGDGVELLIRDHHLNAEEQATLLGELLRRLPGSGVNTQRIWINGHSVWQRQPHSRLQGDA